MIPTTTSVNLIPAPRLATRQRRRHLRAWAWGLTAYAAAVVLACAAVTLFQTDPDAGDTLQQVESTRAANRKASAALVDAAKRLSQAQNAQRMVRVLSDQPDWSLLFAALANRLGNETVLRDVQLRAAPVPTATAAKPQAPARYRLALRGLGKTQAAVSQFVADLEKSQLFDEVRLLRTGREPFLADTAVTFDLDCTLGDGGKR